jgi:hypothetical protein
LPPWSPERSPASLGRLAAFAAGTGSLSLLVALRVAHVAFIAVLLVHVIQRPLAARLIAIIVLAVALLLLLLLAELLRLAWVLLVWCSLGHYGNSL